MITLSLDQIELAKKFTDRRQHAEAQRRKLAAFQAATVSIQFSATHGAFAEKARGDTEMGAALKEALIAHYKAEVVYCNSALKDLGIEVTA